MAHTTHLQVADRLAARLKRSKIPFARDVPIGGVHVDFAFWAPRNQLIIAELKVWEPTHANLSRALHQVTLFKKRTGAAVAYLLVPTMERGQPERGVVNEDELIELLREKFESSAGGASAPRAALQIEAAEGRWVLRGSRSAGSVSVHPTKAQALEAAHRLAKAAKTGVVVQDRAGRIHSQDSYQDDLRAAEESSTKVVGEPSTSGRSQVVKAPPSKRVRRSGIAIRPQQPNPRRIFAAMPFSSDYDDVYMVAMTSAAEAVNAVCERVDHQAYSGDVVERLKATIKKSSAVIVDFSESRPNVLYEAGYADALGIPTINICSTPLENLPFDVRNLRTLKYSKGQTHKLAGILSRELKSILK